VIGHHKTDMGAGMPTLRSKDPEGVAQEIESGTNRGCDVRSHVVSEYVEEVD
jgi:hypothetical protein